MKKLAQGKVVLDTDICKIILCPKNGHRMFVLSESGKWMEMKEMPGDLKGLVNSLDLAINIVSGKFWIKGIALDESKMIESNRGV
jgi:hypothetical protein